MRAATYLGAGRIVVTELGDDPPGAGQVQIEPAYTGICGTDLHIFHGDMDGRVAPGAVIGHETAGRVVAVGPEVTGWRPGDAVTVMPLRACGHCPACVAGHGHVCHRLVFLGIDAPGALQERWTVPAGLLVRLPDELPLDVAALVEPTAVAVHDVFRAGVAPGDRVLVVGGGPIGLLIAVVARIVGADVRITEPDPYRVELARNLGFAVVRADHDDPAAMVEAWTGGAGVAVAFEASGAAAGIATAIEALAVRGRLCLVAIHATPREVNLHRFFWRELTLVGARLYARADFERAVELVAGGMIPAGALVSAIEPLQRVRRAFDMLAAGGVMKVLVDCRHDAAAAGDA
ncbi:MAG: alcohol dehydrogenase catalytic domain-containing protein [Micromonosporaceae bacterium]|nr:alcohol dehydrogenase catalytic domain-containing protein [Micromonosporaceae bacterium]